MIINNPDALKGWLTIILEPLCDADPSALARYVFALLKKDKPLKELKKSMTEQLDVFLGAETKPFLERLFTAIASEEYLTHAKVPTETDNSNSVPVDLDVDMRKIDKECTPPLNDNKTKDFLPVNDEINPNPSGLSQTLNLMISPLSTASLSPVKAASDKENQPREPRRRRASLRSRSRSRSRSGDRNRRSRSRDRRMNEREKSSRQFRNKSPPSDRRRLESRRGAERSPRAAGKTRTKSHSASRSPSPSSERRKISRSSSPPPSSDNSVPVKRQRCRDFDEKGYCVRGETCPWDHGINPVVLEGINNPTLISMPPHLPEYNPDSPELWNRGGNFSGPRGAYPHKAGGMPGNYNRPPGLNFRAGGPPFPFPVNPAATTPLQRELISVPVVDANAGGDISAVQPKRRYEPEDTVAVAEGPAKRKLPINSRLGPRMGPQQNCSLELRKIPRGLNTIAHLNNHFSKFGKIVNIQISYDADPEAAIVTFSTHAEANVAYRSTEAVLNNRFIKVFWHSPGGVQDNTITPGGMKDETITNGRKMSQYHLNNIVPAVPNAAAEGAKTSVATTQGSSTTAANTPANSSSAAINQVTATHAQPPATLRTKNNRHVPPATNAIIRKKQEEHVKAAVQLAHGLHKRKHELLQGYLKQMKQAVELVERVEQSDPQRIKMLDTIKELHTSIEKLRNEIAQEQAQISAQIQNQPPAKKSKEQQKKELLDIELELIAQQQEGNDTTAIQKRLEDLQRSLGISNKPHFGMKNNRARTAPPGSTCVDRRPKTLLIGGFSTEDSDLLLGHFKHFGEITKHEIDRSIPQLIIAYATRASAEQAILRGRTFKDKRLNIAWAPVPIQVLQKSDNNNISKDNKPSEKIESDNLPELRLEDEEEEEDTESEHRSWRR